MVECELGSVESWRCQSCGCGSSHWPALRAPFYCGVRLGFAEFLIPLRGAGPCSLRKRQSVE
eukprot:1597984-Amphidinium_carterae.1